MSSRRPLTFYAGCSILAAAALVALAAPRLAPFDPQLPVGAPLRGPTAAHWLGTNDLGQDQLSLLLFGARTSLLIAGSVVVISALLSWVVGLAAGFFRWAEPPLLTLVDLLLALPSIPLYLLIISLVGASRWTLALMLGLLSWPAYARIVRSLVLQTRSSDYIEAARASGASEFWIVRRHVLPATLDILPTKLALTLRFAIFAEATLAFLGLGASGSISWGTMLSWAFNDPLLFSRPVWPWLIFPPALAVMLLILAAVWVSGGFKREAGAAHERSAARGMEARSVGASVSNLGLPSEEVGASTSA
ncbi:MAG TPA: ABC transporter permease [Nitrolancea sp.]|nr:ABC transporter permease [Nitrolancea sp.]